MACPIMADEAKGYVIHSRFARRLAGGWTGAVQPCARLSRAGSRSLPQQSADHLARGGHRHLLDEGDLARIFVRREPGLDEVLDVGGERIGRRLPGFEHDERL